MPDQFQAQGVITQIKEFTSSLAQAAGTYDLCTASGKVFIPTRDLVVYMASAGVTLTSVSIQTNQTTPTIILTAVEGAVANLLANKVIPHVFSDGITLESGEKIQFTIVGLTGTGSMKTTINFKPVTADATIT